MPPRTPGRSRPKGPPPGETGQEPLYLRFLSEKQVPVTVKLRDGEAVYGWIEYFDDRMIRLTREGKPNLFIYKNQIRTISESARHIEARRRDRNRSGALPPALGNGLPASNTTPAATLLSLPFAVTQASISNSPGTHPQSEDAPNPDGARQNQGGS
jgi:host factor-I protein